MLILRRKSGESIVISDNITLTVLDINEGSVRLAIDAPKSIPILRSELLQAADANRDSAAASPGLFQLLDGKPGAARPGRPRAIKVSASGHPPTPSAVPTPQGSNVPNAAAPSQDGEE